MDIQRSTVIS